MTLNPYQWKLASSFPMGNRLVYIQIVYVVSQKWTAAAGVVRPHRRTDCDIVMVK